LLPVRIITFDEVRQVLDFHEVAQRMRAALIAHSRGECDTPMPMHLDIAERSAEVHMKASYRRGGRYFALKIAATFPPSGNGMMLLSSAENGEPVAFLADGGHLTDVRTAAVAAITARELGRRDRVIGIVGAGIQARLSAALHADLLGPHAIVIWGRSPGRTEACARDIRKLAPRVEVTTTLSVADLAAECRLIVTCTASRAPLLSDHDIAPGTHISAIGADSPGKQELEAATLRRSGLLLVDSRSQCEKLGELQHAPDL